MRKKHLVATIVVLLLIAGLQYAVSHHRLQPIHQSPTPVSGSNSTYIPSTPTKSAGCVAVNDLPDPICTPGSVLATATKDQICVSGYSGTVRNVPVSEKDSVYAEYGITQHSSGEYEVDHLISLELGGSNDIANLWPEAATPTPGFHQKDAFENKLHADVCSGAISLSDAQKEIATNWLQYYTAQ